MQITTINDDKTHYMYFPGYSSSKAQTLKNIDGVLTWRND